MTEFVAHSLWTEPLDPIRHASTTHVISGDKIALGVSAHSTLVTTQRLLEDLSNWILDLVLCGVV
jgi:hypothetical protein